MESEERRAGEAQQKLLLERRAKLGVFVLGARSVALQLTILGGEIFLARKLAPEDWGLYAGVLFVQRFFAQFSEAGFMASLIQRKEAPTRDELSSVWWLQIALSTAVIGVVYVVAPAMRVVWPTMPDGAVTLMRFASLQLLLSSLRVVPSVLLERELRFGRISLADFLDKVTFYVVAGVLALRDFHAGAFVGGLLAGNAVAALLLLVVRPFFPRFRFEMALVRPLLRFSLAFQAKSFLSMVNDAATPMYGLRVLGQERLGFANFAQRTGWFALRFVEIVGRVSFPLYSRLSADPEAFSAAIERSLSACALAVFLYGGLVFGLGPAIVHVVYGDKWLPAIPALYVYAGVFAVGFLSPVIGAALDAAGRPQILTKLIAGWSLINWVSIVVVTLFFRTPLAFALAFAVHVVVGNLACVFVLQRVLPDVRVWRFLLVPALACVASASLGRLLLLPTALSGVVGLVVAIAASMATYGVGVLVMDRQALSSLVNLLRKKK